MRKADLERFHLGRQLMSVGAVARFDKTTRQAARMIYPQHPLSFTATLIARIDDSATLDCPACCSVLIDTQKENRNPEAP